MFACWHPNEGENINTIMFLALFCLIFEIFGVIFSEFGLREIPAAGAHVLRFT